MAKTLDENWIDWEGSTFGFGYGSGEPHTVPALRRFLELTPEDKAYDYQFLEAELGATTAWLLINALARHGVDILEYGTSPRFAWLTKEGRALRRFTMSKTADELVELSLRHGDEYTPCYPHACNCGPDGYEKDRLCPNPFWVARPGIG